MTVDWHFSPVNVGREYGLQALLEMFRELEEKMSISMIAVTYSHLLDFMPYSLIRHDFGSLTCSHFKGLSSHVIWSECLDFFLSFPVSESQSQKGVTVFRCQKCFPGWYLASAAVHMAEFLLYSSSLLKDLRSSMHVWERYVYSVALGANMATAAINLNSKVLRSQS